MWLRLRQIALVAPELAPVVEDLKSVFGLEVCFRDPGVSAFGLENALFPVGNQFIEVVAPVEENTAAGRYLERRGGAGGYMVITQCDEHAPRRRRVEELGVRIVHQFDHPSFRNMQLHPKDTGGSFFEIDEQLGDAAHDPDGPWLPAGGADWKGAQRLDRVRGIAAAEIQADDPARVAARWSEIAELPLEQTRDGAPRLRLGDGEVRFVPCRDGRPEGLGGLDLRTADRDAVLKSARERGCLRDDLVHVCGMRFNLL